MLLGGDPGLRLVDVPGTPQRSIFTAARATTAERPAIAACRAVLAEVADERGR
jgi:hypothetical protein